MMNITLRLLFLSLLLSCGVEKTSYESKKEKVIQTNYANEIVPLRKQSNSCATQRFTHYDFDFNLRLDKNDVLQTRNFFSLMQGIYLRDGKIISKATYGEKVELLIQSGLVQERILKRPKNITICPEDKFYDEDTVENAALSAAHFIRKTYENFKIVAPEVKINPIELKISPVIIRSYLSPSLDGLVRRSYFESDNARYIPSMNTVLFLPSGKSNESDVKSDFWEVPMVVSHEYGHHIFNSIYPSTSQPTIHNCFHNEKPDVSSEGHSAKSGVLYRRVTARDVLDAYNEGFADLISYYSLDESERGVSGVICLDTTRDVGSKTLIDGKPKLFNEKVLSTFLAAYEEGSNCSYPSYQEIHVFGAIFAHTADSFLSILTDKKSEKLSAITDWLKFMNAQRRKFTGMSAESYFKVSYANFLNISLKKFGRDFDSVTCAKIREIAPELKLSQCEGL